MKPISVAIPTHDDRWAWTSITLRAIHDDPRVSEVVLRDDCSDGPVREKLQDQVRSFNKVKLILGDKRELVMRNKLKAVEACSSEFVALWDSDNVFDASYLDAFEQAIDAGCPRDAIAYLPQRARPRFDFSEWSGRFIDRTNIVPLMQSTPGVFKVCLNTGNYVVRRNAYLKQAASAVLLEEPPSVCDVIWLAYYLFTAGEALFVIPGMEYDHTIHAGSTFRKYEHLEADATRKAQERLLSL